MNTDRQGAGSARTTTLEAFADTVVPGEKQRDGDRTVAGAASGGGAVAAGAVPLLEMPEGGLAPALDTLAAVLDEQARAYGRPLARAHPATMASRSLS